jgi:hypothetical protein
MIHLSTVRGVFYACDSPTHSALIFSVAPKKLFRGMIGKPPIITCLPRLRSIIEFTSQEKNKSFMVVLTKLEEA